jgi:hypothetical protein
MLVIIKKSRQQNYKLESIRRTDKYLICGRRKSKVIPIVRIYKTKKYSKYIFDREAGI